MTIYYLMIKSHNITGLKYLCQTKKKDPYSYKGSGKYWKLHLKQHGNSIHTEILKECSTKDELVKWGKYYSDIWNIVDSDEWANLKPETGDGGPLFGLANGMYGKTHTDEVVLAIKQKNTGRKLGTLTERYGPEKARIMREGRKNSMHNARTANKEWGDRLIKTASSPEAIAKRSGSNHYRHDHTIYHWYHKETDTSVHLTRQSFCATYSLPSSNITNLIKRKHKHCKGWTIIKP
jgi:hypothetical protein